MSIFSKLVSATDLASGWWIYQTVGQKLLQGSIDLSPRLVCRCVLFILMIATQVGRAQPTNASSDQVVSRFRVGPLFEYRATREGGTFWALRPFYSKLSDPVSQTCVTDVVWPLNTFHRADEQSWWRVLLLAYGSNDNEKTADAAWKTVVLPLWFQGRTRSGDDYWALFPLQGHIPHLFLMEDLDFTLFPFYFNFEINHVERVYTPWPFYSRVSKNEALLETGVFPFWCRQKNAKSQTDRLYAFWPFWTLAVYNGTRNPGSSCLLFPLYGEVNREKEYQRLVLPPFFSHAKTDSAERWRVPWPFYETMDTWITQNTTRSSKRSYWPFYGKTVDDQSCSRYACWPIYWYSRITNKSGNEERTRLFPFYADESRYVRDNDGTLYESEHYTRVWPFYERVRTSDASHLRILAFNPIRHSGGIERNWAPFWTVYERIESQNMITHDALWGLFNYQRASRKEVKEVLP